MPVEEAKRTQQERITQGNLNQRRLLFNHFCLCSLFLLKSGGKNTKNFTYIVHINILLSQKQQLIIAFVISQFTAIRQRSTTIAFRAKRLSILGSTYVFLVKMHVIV